MTIENNSWHHYLSLHQRCSAGLQTALTAEALFNAAITLTKHRLAQHHAPTISALTANTTQLSASVWQTELLLYYADYYSLCRINRQLLLVAGWCSALFTDCQNTAQRAAALATAKYLSSCPAAQKISRLLSHCYPAERKQPIWRQDLLSLLLTEADYLRNASGGQLHPKLAQRLMHSNNEYELALLRSLLQHTELQQSEFQLSDLHQPEINADSVIRQLIKQSRYHELSQADNRRIEQTLAQHPENAATVLAIASALNRQQQQVDSIRLAISLLGRDNLTVVLAQAELNGYLRSLRHPWQQLFEQFSGCLAQALLLSLNDQHSAASCQLLASCLVAPLWQADIYPRSALTHQTQSSFTFRFNPLHTIQTASYLSQVSALLRLYRLQPYHTAVGLWHQHVCGQSDQLDSLSIALQQAWTISLQLFCGSAPAATALQRSAPSNLAAPDNRDLLLQLAELSGCYIPLNLTL